MTEPASISFSTRGGTAEIENGLEFQPNFNEHGLIGAVATDAKSGEVLMFAWMNADALRLTIETGAAHFWSRSRKRLWKKGEESGNVLSVEEMRIDCDQDAIWLRVTVGGVGAACHTGERSCFYRRIAPGETKGQGARLTRVTT